MSEIQVLHGKSEEEDCHSPIPLLTVYIPTHGRPDLCLEQVSCLAAQIREGRFQSLVAIVVAINGDNDYDTPALRRLGAEVILRQSNLGGNANICLGFEYLDSAEYLWILSDDDPVSPNSIVTIIDCINEFDSPDLVTGIRSGSTRLIQLDSPDTPFFKYEGSLISLISATVYKSDVFRHHFIHALQSLYTHFPHVVTILSGYYSRLNMGLSFNVGVIPISQMVDINQFERYTNSIIREDIGASHGAIFFGGGLIPLALTDRSAQRRESGRWWRSNWHRCSMYRRTNSAEQVVVDSLARSDLSNICYYALSLPPWWRIKNAFDYVRLKRFRQL